MQNIQTISRHELEAKISETQIRVMQIMYIAMGVTQAAMITVVAVFYKIGKTRPLPEEPINTLSLKYMMLALVFAALLEYGLFIILPKLRLAMAGATFIAGNQQNTIDKIPLLLSAYRSITIIRLALLEGVALFGIVILLLAVTQFTIYSQSAYWLCLTPSVILFAYLYLFFPTRDRVIFYIENNFLKNSN